MKYWQQIVAVFQTEGGHTTEEGWVAAPWLSYNWEHFFQYGQASSEQKTAKIEQFSIKYHLLCQYELQNKCLMPPQGKILFSHWAKPYVTVCLEMLCLPLAPFPISRAFSWWRWRWKCLQWRNLTSFTGNRKSVVVLHCCYWDARNSLLGRTVLSSLSPAALDSPLLSLLPVSKFSQLKAEDF